MVWEVKRGRPKRFIRSNIVDFLKMLGNYPRCKGTGELKLVSQSSLPVTL